MDRMQIIMNAIHQMDLRDKLLTRLLACAELNQEDLEPETITLLGEINELLYSHKIGTAT